jgi:hypothetical protein
LAELAEDPSLRPHVIRALCVGNLTSNLSLAVQYVLEERDRQVDNVLFDAARDLKEPYDPRD